MTTSDSHPLIARGRTAELYAWDGGKVLKLFHDWMSDFTIENEAQKSRRLSEAGLPVPQVFDVIQHNGRRGIVYERVDGPTMLAELKRRMWKIGVYARQMADLHARLHAVQIDGLPALHDHLRWKIEHAAPLPDPLKQAALDALERLPQGSAVCHGDFHPDNILLSARGPIIIDWMDVTHGHPLGDVARTRLLITSGDPPPGTSVLMGWLINRVRRTLHDVYLRRYLALTGISRAEADVWRFPVVAARLHDMIPNEVGPLLAEIERLHRA